MNKIYKKFAVGFIGALFSVALMLGGLNLQGLFAVQNASASGKSVSASSGETQTISQELVGDGDSLSSFVKVYNNKYAGDNGFNTGLKWEDIDQIDYSFMGNTNNFMFKTVVNGGTNEAPNYQRQYPAYPNGEEQIFTTTQYANLETTPTTLCMVTENKGVTLDGVTTNNVSIRNISLASTDYVSGGTIGFSFWGESDQNRDTKWGYVRFYKSGVLVAEFLPSTDGSGTICFKETVSSTTETPIYIYNLKTNGQLTNNASTASNLTAVYLDPVDGTDENLGTNDWCAVKTIGRALALSATNATIKFLDTMEIENNGTISNIPKSITLSPAESLKTSMFLCLGNAFFEGLIVNGNSSIATNAGVISSFNSDASLTITDCFFNNCSSSISGGVINSSATVFLENSTFTNCTSGANGGAIYSTKNVILEGCSFDSCSATNTNATATTCHGGAVYAGGDLEITDCSFNNCSVTNTNTSNTTVVCNGGAVFVGGNATINGATFNGNTAKNNGGALYVTGNLDLDSGTFTSNTASSGDGGGAYVGGNANVTNSTFGGFKQTADTIYQSGKNYYTYDSATDKYTQIATNTYTAGTTAITGTVYESLGNTAEYSGGIRIGKGNVTNCHIYCNYATRSAGGIYAEESVLSNCFICYNNADAGAGCYFGNSNKKSFVIDCYINNNTCRGPGGAIYSNGELEVRNSYLNNNSSAGEGGAIKVVYSSITLIDCVLHDNKNTSGNGGGINSAGNATITGSYIYNNTSSVAGGGVCVSINATITGSYIYGNSSLYGGAMYSNGNVTIKDCAIYGNSATSYGGGVYAKGYVNATNTTFGGYTDANNNGVYDAGDTLLGNSAGLDGGAIYINYTTGATNCTFTNCNFIGNKSTGGNGGALFNVATSNAYTLVLNNCNFEYNMAKLSGGAFYASTDLTADSCNFLYNSAFSDSGVLYIISGKQADFVDCNILYNYNKVTNCDNFNLKGCIVKYNISPSVILGAGNIYSGTTISNNICSDTSNAYSSGVCVSNGIYNITDDKIVIKNNYACANAVEDNTLLTLDGTTYAKKIKSDFFDSNDEITDTYKDDALDYNLFGAPSLNGSSTNFEIWFHVSGLTAGTPLRCFSNCTSEMLKNFHYDNAESLGVQLYFENGKIYAKIIDDEATTTIEYTVSAYYGAFDGEEHGIDVQVYNKDILNNLLIEYSLSDFSAENYDETNTLTDNPTYIDAMTNAVTVYYRLSATGCDTINGSSTVHILKQSLTIVFNNAQLKGVYFGQTLSANSDVSQYLYGAYAQDKNGNSVSGTWSFTANYAPTVSSFAMSSLTLKFTPDNPNFAVVTRAVGDQITPKFEFSSLYYNNGSFYQDSTNANATSGVTLAQMLPYLKQNGTVTFNSTYTVSANETITLDNYNIFTFTKTNVADSIFKANSGKTFTITATNHGCKLTISGYDTTVTTNKSLIENLGTLIINGNVIIQNNKTTTCATAEYKNGAGIYNNGILKLTGVTLTNLTGVNGGAIYNKYSTTTANNVPTLTNCKLDTNTATNGGAIYNEGTLTLENCAILNNTATTSGNNGGHGLYTLGNATIKNSSLLGSSTTKDLMIVDNSSNAPTVTFSGSTTRSIYANCAKAGSLTLSGKCDIINGLSINFYDNNNYKYQLLVSSLVSKISVTKLNATANGLVLCCSTFTNLTSATNLFALASAISGYVLSLNTTGQLILKSTESTDDDDEDTEGGALVYGDNYVRVYNGKNGTGNGFNTGVSWTEVDRIDYCFAGNVSDFLFMTIEGTAGDYSRNTPTFPSGLETVLTSAQFTSSIDYLCLILDDDYSLDNIGKNYVSIRNISTDYSGTGKIALSYWTASTAERNTYWFYVRFYKNGALIKEYLPASNGAYFVETQSSTTLQNVKENGEVSNANTKANDIYVDFVNGNDNDLGFAYWSAVKTLERAQSLSCFNSTIRFITSYNVSDGEIVKDIIYTLSPADILTDSMFVCLGSATFENLIIDGKNISFNFSAVAIKSTSNKAISIKNCIINNCNSSSSAGAIYTTGTCTIENSKIYNNTCTKGTVNSVENVGGAGVCSVGALTITNSAVYNNTATGMGGGIYCQAAITMTNCQVYNNTSTAQSGGGICCQATMTMTNCQIYNNISDGAGGGLNVGNIIMTNCQIYNNKATSFGGANVGGLIRADNCSIYSNRASGQCGGIGSGYKVFLTNCSVYDNRAGYRTGIVGQELFLTNCYVYGNVAFAYSAGIHGFDCVDIKNSYIYNNKSEQNSGGISTTRGHAIITDSYIYGNKSNIDGGGIYTNCTTTINNCYIFNNYAGSGGGIWANSTTTITNSDIYENYATQNGGGIYATGSTTVNNCYVYGNKANSASAIFTKGGTIKDCEIYNNKATTQIINVQKASLKNCSIHDNHCSGAIITLSGTTKNVKDCQIYNNICSQVISSTDYNAGNVVNCLISGNTCSSYLFNVTGLININKNKILNNSCLCFVGVADNSTANYVDCLISGNTAKSQSSGSYFAKVNANQSLSFDGCEIYNNAVLSGSGKTDYFIWNAGGTLDISDCRFTNNLINEKINNVDTYVFAGIYTSSGLTNIESCDFINNYKDNNDAIRFAGSLGLIGQNGGENIITNCYFANNNGGANGLIVTTSGSETSLFSLLFEKNKGVLTNLGGNAYVFDINVLNNNFDGNYGVGASGEFYLLSGNFISNANGSCLHLTGTSVVERIKAMGNTATTEQNNTHITLGGNKGSVIYNDGYLSLSDKYTLKGKFIDLIESFNSDNGNNGQNRGYNSLKKAYSTLKMLNNTLYLAGNSATYGGVIFNDTNGVFTFVSGTIGGVSGNINVPTNTVSSGLLGASQPYYSTLNSSSSLSSTSGLNSGVYESLLTSSSTSLSGYNTAVYGGAIYNKGLFTFFGGTMSYNTTTNSNDATGDTTATMIASGGAIYNIGTFVIDAGNFENNTSYNGGAICNLGLLTINDGNYTLNTAVNGGVIFNAEATLDTLNTPTNTDDDVTFTGELIVNYGEFYNNTLDCSTVVGNGIIYNNAKMHIFDCLMQNNTSTGSKGANGAIYSSSGSNISEILGGEFVSNHNASVISLNSGLLTVENVYINPKITWNGSIWVSGFSCASGTTLNFRNSYYTYTNGTNWPINTSGIANISNVTFENASSNMGFLNGNMNIEDSKFINCSCSSSRWFLTTSNWIIKNTIFENISNCGVFCGNPYGSTSNTCAFIDCTFKNCSQSNTSYSFITTEGKVENCIFENNKCESLLNCKIIKDCIIQNNLGSAVYVNANNCNLIGENVIENNYTTGTVAGIKVNASATKVPITIGNNSKLIVDKNFVVTTENATSSDYDVKFGTTYYKKVKEANLCVPVVYTDALKTMLKGSLLAGSSVGLTLYDSTEVDLSEYIGATIIKSSGKITTNTFETFHYDNGLCTLLLQDNAIKIKALYTGLSVPEGGLKGTINTDNEEIEDISESENIENPYRVKASEKTYVVDGNYYGYTKDDFSVFELDGSKMSASEYKVKFSDKIDGVYTETCPTYCNLGERVIYYKIFDATDDTEMLTSGSVKLSIVKKTLSVIETPQVFLAKGKTLNDATFIGGRVVDSNGNVVAGTWAFDKTTTIPSDTTTKYALTFTPASVGTYEAVATTTTNVNYKYSSVIYDKVGTTTGFYLSATADDYTGINKISEIVNYLAPNSTITFNTTYEFTENENVTALDTIYLNFAGSLSKIFDFTTDTNVKVEFNGADVKIVNLTFTGYLFYVPSNATLTLGANVLIANCGRTTVESSTNSPAIIYNGGTLNLNGASMIYNTATLSSGTTVKGGLIYNLGNLNFNGGDFVSNSLTVSTADSNAYGGIVYNYGGVVNVNSGTFSANSISGKISGFGGVFYNANDGSISINGGKFCYNTASNGGVVGNSNGRVTFNGGIMLYNTATTSGAIVYLDTASTDGEIYYNGTQMVFNSLYSLNDLNDDLTTVDVDIENKSNVLPIALAILCGLIGFIIIFEKFAFNKKRKRF